MWEVPSNDRLELPATVKPEGPGYFPLYCAAQWIATQGGTQHFDPTNSAIWAAAFLELMARIASDQVTVTGVRNGIREKIEGYVFASMRVDHPFVDTPFDLILSEELYLSSYAYVDDEHWQNGFDDSLKTRSGVHWSKLMVPKSDIAKFWPLSPERAAGTASFRTGAPGRPTPIYLIDVEHRRRLDVAEAKTSVSAEAKHLAEWLKRSHQNVPPLTPKTIENRIRVVHRQAMKPRN